MKSPISLPYPLHIDDEAALISAFSQTRNVQRKSVLARQGGPSHEIKIIREGFAFRSKTTFEGGRQVVGLITKGQVCDVSSLFFESADHTIEAVTDCQIATAPIAAVKDLFANRPACASAFFALTLMREAVAYEWVLNVGRRNSRQRIAHLLCEIIVCTSQNHNEHSCTLPLIQADIADATGLSIVQVNKTLGDFRTEAIISLENKLLSALDWRKLCVIAEFDPAYLR